MFPSVGWFFSFSFSSFAQVLRSLPDGRMLSHRPTGMRIRTRGFSRLRSRPFGLHQFHRRASPWHAADPATWLGVPPLTFFLLAGPGPSGLLPERTLAGFDIHGSLSSSFSDHSRARTPFRISAGQARCFSGPPTLSTRLHSSLHKTGPVLCHVPSQSIQAETVARCAQAPSCYFAPEWWY